jgi:hypothetical protein
MVDAPYSTSHTDLCIFVLCSCRKPSVFLSNLTATMKKKSLLVGGNLRISAETLSKFVGLS